MNSLLDYLQDPNLVASFQRAFGIKVTSRAHDQLLEHKTTKSNHFKLASLRSEKLDTQSGGNRCIHPKKSSPIEQSLTVETQVNFRITQKFFYYLFMFGAALGYETFYATFFPFWFWNVDSFVGRRLIIVWVGVMYIGQAIKDIIKKPRPSSPPVVVLEPEYSLEYGMPSTHAMTGVALPFSLLIFTHSRYEYDLWIGAVLACFWCALVCTSRLYNGMHSYLDIIAGIIFAALLMIILVPLADAIDDIHLKSPYSPLITVPLVVALSYYYPKPERWSPARGDTCVIMGAGFGILLGSWFSYQTGMIREAIQIDANRPPFPIIWPAGVSLIIIRSVIGICCVIAARAVGKVLSYTALCSLHGLDAGDPKTKQVTRVELPHKLITYLLLGISITWLSPTVFRILNLERATMFTEV